MEALEEEPCLATGESDSIDMLGSAFFDSDSDDDRSSSKIVKARDSGEGSSISGKVPTKLNGSDVDKPDKVHYRVRGKLAEVFSVRFLAFEELNLEDVYGVMFVNGLFCYVFFERYFGDPLPIDSKGYVIMTGPKRAIAPADDLSWEEYLFNSRMMEHPWGRPGSMWTLMDTSYDQLLRSELMTDFGPVEVMYAVYKNSAEAILEITLIDWKGKEECASSTEVEIFGTVSARNNKTTDSDAQSLLFCKEREEALCIGYGDVIPLPLSRNVTVLPLGSILMVDFCIRHCSDKSSMDGILVGGTVEFNSCLSGEEEEIICGERGKIKVKATWKENVSWVEIGGHL